MAFRDEPSDLYTLLEPLVAQRPESNKSLPAAIRSAAEASLARNRAVAPSDARILGRAYVYVKQVDVVIAQWSRGAELLMSTKTMVASFRKNLANRFEEAYGGDTKNLRDRYQLVAMDFLFILR